MMNWYGLTKLSYAQHSYDRVLADYQRYLADSYTTKVALTSLRNNYTVSISMYHTQLGGTHWQEFWRYGSNESATANSTFKEVKSKIDEMVDEFSGTEIPTCMMYTTLREAVRHIDIDHKPKTRVPWIDWAKEKDGVADWRSSIYGTRYPSFDGF